MNKLLLTGLTLLLVVAGATVAFGVVGDDDGQDAATAVTSTATQGTGTTTNDGGTDISGPCDEAEHADDPRCAGGARDDDRDDRGRDHPEDDRVSKADDDAFGEDVSGPCDEAEHADDPRCTGAAPMDDDDHGFGDDHGSDDHGGDDDSRGHGGDDDGYDD
jgi:hypothetical protein